MSVKDIHPPSTPRTSSSRLFNRIPLDKHTPLQTILMERMATFKPEKCVIGMIMGAETDTALSAVEIGSFGDGRRGGEWDRGGRDRC